MSSFQKLLHLNHRLYLQQNLAEHPGVHDAVRHPTLRLQVLPTGLVHVHGLLQPLPPHRQLLGQHHHLLLHRRRIQVSLPSRSSILVHAARASPCALKCVMSTLGFVSLC